MSGKCSSSADAPVADTTDQDFALVIYNGTAGMASAIADADALIDERYSFDFDGIGGGGSDLLIGGDSAPGQRVSFLISDSAIGLGEGSVDLLGTSDALAPTDFFLV